MLVYRGSSDSARPPRALHHDRAFRPENQCGYHLGSPSGYVEADLFEEPRPVSSETLAAIEAGLPSLFAHLVRLIVQGKP